MTLGAQLRHASETVEAELDQIDHRLAEAARRPVGSPRLSAVDPGAAFLAAPLHVQPAVLAAVVLVEVAPPGPQRRGAGRACFAPVAE